MRGSTVREHARSLIRSLSPPRRALLPYVTRADIFSYRRDVGCLDVGLTARSEAMAACSSCFSWVGLQDSSESRRTQVPAAGMFYGFEKMCDVTATLIQIFTVFRCTEVAVEVTFGKTVECARARS